jgi:2-oxoglutarate ferredoxin oxidoreductase subunit beta
MSYLPKPRFHHKGIEANALGFTRRDYEGALSTLCAGCGHDSISAALIQAFFELDIEPHRVAKLSGIGCSSKTPDYFLGQSHGFNSVHGRMPSVLTGANLANRDLIYLGISGDGDSASIGIGQFVHCVRRAVNMLYVCENNGVYGLTKGQFSATADTGSKSKAGGTNADQPIDLVSLALIAGATFVARSFSGDKTQLVPLLKAGLAHKGAAVIDVISPCIAFNNHAGSTKSLDFVREHNAAVNRLDFFEGRAPITLDQAPGTVEVVEQHDGSVLRLHKIAEDYDPRDKVKAMDYLQRRHAAGELVTGLLYLDPNPKDLHAAQNTVDAPLNRLGADVLCPGSVKLAEFNADYRAG